MSAPATAAPCDPGQALALARIDRLLEPEPMAVETGCCRLPDGVRFVAVRTPMPGVSAEMIQRFRGRIPILGVCLGHQTIGDCHGMTVRRSGAPMHGKTSPIHHDGRGIFEGLPNPFDATRYHSLIVDRAALSPDFEVSAWTEDGTIMGLRWRGPPGSAPMDGVQFHPESFLTLEGPRLLASFLEGRPAPLTPSA